MLFSSFQPVQADAGPPSVHSEDSSVTWCYDIFDLIKNKKWWGERKFNRGRVSGGRGCVCVRVCLAKGQVVYGDLVTFRLSGTIRRLSVEEWLGSGCSHMPLLTPCITISANGALQGNYHQYDIKRRRLNQSGKKCLSVGNKDDCEEVAHSDNDTASEPWDGPWQNSCRIHSICPKTCTHTASIHLWSKHSPCFSKRQHLFLFHNKEMLQPGVVFVNIKLCICFSNWVKKSKHKVLGKTSEVVSIQIFSLTTFEEATNLSGWKWMMCPRWAGVRQMRRVTRMQHNGTRRCFHFPDKAPENKMLALLVLLKHLRSPHFLKANCKILPF